jgi:hypothetical protein
LKMENSREKNFIFILSWRRWKRLIFPSCNQKDIKWRWIFFLCWRKVWKIEIFRWYQKLMIFLAILNYRCIKQDRRWLFGVTVHNSILCFLFLEGSVLWEPFLG